MDIRKILIISGTINKGEKVFVEDSDKNIMDQVIESYKKMNIVLKSSRGTFQEGFQQKQGYYLSK